MEQAILLSILLSGTALSILVWSFYHSYKKSVSESLNQTLLLIQLPQKKKEEESDLEKEINESSQLFSLLTSFKKPFTLEVAVPHIGEEIHFFISISKSHTESAKRQIHSLWPEAEIIESEDFNIFSPEGAFSIAYLKQKLTPSLPIRTYLDVKDDTFSPILSGLSRINELGEGAALQIIVRPTNQSKFQKMISSKIEDVKKGKKLAEILEAENSPRLKDFFKALKGKEKSPSLKEGEIAPPENISVDEDLLKSFQEKISKPIFEVNIRIVSSAPTKLQADSILEGILSGFSQLSSLRKNEFKAIRPRNDKNLIFDFSFRRFSHHQKESSILNSDELASIFHFPISLTGIPRIKWLKSRSSEPPENLPSSGVLIGESVFRGQRKEVYITDTDRRRHVYIIGQTGTGKSTLMRNMAISDIRRGKGIAIIDPHGDLVNDIASLVPQERIDDVVIFDPSDIDHPVGLNMLEFNPSRPEEKTFIVNEMQSIFNRLFSEETMGPMFEQYMRNTLLLLMEDSINEPATLIEVPRVLTDPAYRKKKLDRILNTSVIDFWTKEAEKAGGDAALENMAPYITSKFNNFIANDYVRPIIGQPKNSFNFRQIMDEGKILLVNLSKGRIGDINANLLGMIITGKLLMSALSRVDIPEEERRDFYLFIDEFQNFTTDSISTILSEARKYRLNLTIAHQFIAQLPENIKDAVFGNVGSLISFRIGASDGEILEKQLAPIFNQNDLINISNFNAYLKILIDNQPTRAFNMKIFPSDFGNRERAEQIKQLSRQKFGRSRSEVEERIIKSLRS